MALPLSAGLSKRFAPFPFNQQQMLEGTRIKNFQGYEIFFKMLKGRLVCDLERDGQFIQNVTFKVLSSSKIDPGLLTFDHFSREVILGQFGLLGGGCGSSREVEPTPSQMELTTSIPVTQVYVGAEAPFTAQAQAVIQCLQEGQIKAVDAPSTATHYFLFITDSFLKSQELLLPLLEKMSDPFFKQRLFPVIVDKGLSIFSPGTENLYVDYWKDQPAIRDKIGPFIRAIRDTLMPPIEELLQNRLAKVTEAIGERSHLLERKSFYFLPESQVDLPESRKASLTKLQTLFQQKQIVTLTGPERIGKTTLAIEYAKSSTTYRKGIFLLDATNQQTLDASFITLASQLGIDPQAVQQRLSKMKDFLLIFDNVTNPSIVPKISSGHTLILSSKLKGEITLQPFTTQEAEQLLSSQLNLSGQEAQFLTQTLENHPGKLADAIAYIKQTKMSAKDYLAYYYKNQGQLENKQQKAKKTKGGSSGVVLASSALDPTPQTIEKYLKMPHSQVIQEFIQQGLQLFVSYSWSAKSDVEQIDSSFHQMGIQLLRDARELQTFASVKEFMKKVIQKADYTFSVINTAYLKSFNCLFEIVTTLQDPDWRQRLFPLILSGTDLSDETILSYQTYWEQEAVRLENTGATPEEIALAQEGSRLIAPYLRFVRDSQPTSIEEQLSTQFHTSMALMLARQEKLEKKGIYKQEIFHLPLGRNKDFTGRDKEMAQLESTLQKGLYSAITNTGTGGVGKSQLALEYTYRHQADYNMVYWIRSESIDQIRIDLRALGLQMGINEELLKDEFVIATMKGVLEKKSGWLLVFDNAEDPALLKQVMPTRGGHMIVTSRNPNWDKTVTVDVFSPKEALTYLTRVTGLTDPELALLAQDLGYLPLALTQAAAYIRRQQIDVATYRATFKEKGQQLLTQREKGYPGTVATTWQISMEKVTEEDPNAVELLNLCSYLAPDRIPEKVLSTWLDRRHNTSMGLDFHDALRILETYALIDQKIEQKEGTRTKWISIHRLIHLVTRDQCEPQEASNTLQLGVEVVNDQFEGDVGTQKEREAAESLVNHAKSLVEHVEAKALWTEAGGSLANSVGIFFYKSALLKEALEMVQKALKIRIACYGTENHTSVARCYNNIGNVLQGQGDLKGALEMHQKALNIRIACLGTENHTDVAASYNNIGGVLGAQGDLKGALEIYQKAVKIQIACLGTENHTDVAASYNNIGLVLQAQGELKGALEMYQKALKIRISCLGTENHTDVAQSYNNIGNVLYSQGDLKGALEMVQKAFKIKIACLGTENHTDVAGSYVGIGNVLKTQGDLKGALEIYQKAVKIQIDCLGTENHTDVAGSYMGIGNVLEDQGDLKGALEMHQKALGIRIACFGTENHTDVAASYNNIGNVLRAQGDLKGALEMHQKALGIRIACFGTENHTDVAASYMGIGAVLQGQGDLKGALEIYQKAVKIKIACLGTENHTDVAGSYMGIGNVLQDQGDLKGALEMHQKALGIRIACLGTENHTDVAASYNNIGIVLYSQGDLKGALEIYQKALGIRIACLGTENHTDVAASYNNIGAVLQGQGDLKGALQMYQKALGIRIACLGTENHTDVATSFMNIGLVLKDQGDLKGALQMVQKAVKIQIDCLGTDNHTDVAASYMGIGNVLYSQGDLKGALEMHQKSLKIKIACLGTENHIEVAKSYSSIGDVIKLKGDLKNAKEYYLKAKEICRRCEGNRYDAFFDQKIQDCETGAT